MFVGQELLMHILSDKLVASFLDAPGAREEITLVQVRLFVLLKRWAHSLQPPRVVTNAKAMAILAGSTRHLLASCPWLDFGQKSLLFELCLLAQDGGQQQQRHYDGGSGPLMHPAHIAPPSEERLRLFYAEVIDHLGQLAWSKDLACQLTGIEGAITFGIPARDLLRHGIGHAHEDHRGTPSRAIRAYYRHVGRMHDLFTALLLDDGKEEAEGRARAICRLLQVAQVGRHIETCNVARGRAQPADPVLTHASPL